MIKKQIVLLVLVLLIGQNLFPVFSKAATGDFTAIEIFDPYSLITSGPSYENLGDRDRITINTSGTAAKSVTFTTYSDSSFSTVTATKTLSAEEYGWTYFKGLSFSCNSYYEGILKDEGGEVLVRAKLHITGLVNPSCDSGSDGDSMGGGEKTCTDCAVLQCPEWQVYMGKLDDIAAKIPPVPNWTNISNEIWNTIGPRVISDLQSMLGSTPSPPGAPAAPAVPTAPAPGELEGLDDRGTTAPEGSEAPGLDDSTFSPDDIKSQAPAIQERKDESGGFEINDPMTGLPSQEEFMKNLPKPEEGESPNPAEQDLPSPAAPKDDDNLAPNPVDTGATAPTPTEGSNTAPIPGNDGSTAPIPGDNTDQAPIPDKTNETAPLPTVP